MGKKKKRKKEIKWRKNREKIENQGISREEKTNDEKRQKKRNKDSMDKINDDGWIIKRKTKRSKTEAEDIRRYFRTEDKH